MANNNAQNNSVDLKTVLRLMESGEVVSYQTLRQFKNQSEEVNAKMAEMEAVMTPVLEAPNNVDVILAYGLKPMDKLEAISNKMIEVQTKYDSEFNVIKKSWDDYDSALAKMGFDELLSSARDAVGVLGRTTGKGAKGATKLLTAIFEKMSGAAKERTEAENTIKKMQDQIPGMMQELNETIKKTGKVKSGMRTVRTQCTEALEMRLEIIKELNTYIGAGREILRQYDEEIIPEYLHLVETANGDSTNTDQFSQQGKESQRLYEEIIDCKREFSQQMLQLEQAKAILMTRSVRATQIIKNTVMQERFLTQMETIGVTLMKDGIVEAGQAGSSLKASEFIQKRRQAADRVLEGAGEMADMSQKIMLEAAQNGIFSHEKVLESAQKVKAALEERRNFELNHAKILEQQENELRAATSGLIESKEAINKDRVLESSPTVRAESELAKKNDAKELAEKPVNDNVGELSEQDTNPASSDPAAPVIPAVAKPTKKREVKFQ